MGYSYPIYEPKYANSIAELMARQGDIQARGAERSGEIWSNAINQIGQLAGGTVQSILQKKSQEKKEAGISNAINSWDGTNPLALHRALAPFAGSEGAMKLTSGVVALQQMGTKDDGQDEKRLGVALGAAEDLSDTQLTQMYPALRTKALPVLTRLGMAPEMFPEEYGPGLKPYMKKFGQLLRGEKPAEPKAPEPFTLSPDQVRFDASGKQIASGLPKPVKPEKLTLDQRLSATLPEGATADQILGLKAREAAMGRAPKEAPEPLDFGSIVRKSESGTPYVSAGDVAGVKEATQLSKWSRENGVRFLPKQDADQLTEVQNARMDLQHAYDSVKDLFASNIGGVYLNKGSAKLQATDAGERLAAYKKTLNEASVRLSRATSGGKNLRLNKDLLDKALAAMPNPMSDVAGTAAKGFNESMSYLQNVEDSLIRPTDVGLAKNESALSQRYGGR